MECKEYDFTVFGATGYTGRYVFRNLILWQEIEKIPRKVAIAGRNKAKLESLVKETALQLDKNLDSVGLIIAEVENEESLLSMCKKTKVLLNTCGPYILYGEQVVKACIQRKTHMVDISGENQYLEGMQLKYHEAARSAGVYIIGSCGYDAIPAEIGIDYLKQKFSPGRLSQVEGFLKSKHGKHGITLNYGALRSLVGTNPSKALEVRNRYQSQLFTKNPPVPKFPMKLKFLPWKNEELGGWCVPMSVSDRDIVANSQRWFYEYLNERPVQFEEYIVVPKIYHAIILTLGMLYFNFLTYFNCTRKLLLKYPKFFTIGYFSKEGPTRRQLEDISFTFQCVGKGWTTTPSGSSGEYNHPPNKTISCLIFGPDPGYETTSRCLIQSGLTILEESDKMPFEGGCLTPAFAFRNTSLRQRLNRHAVSYELIG